MKTPLQTVELEQQSSQYAQLAGFCKAAGDPLRLEILKVLAGNAYGVLELCQLFEVKQSGMSHHLKVLANAGLVSTRREGNSIFYRRALGSENPALQPVHQALLSSIDTNTLSPELTERIEQLHGERSQSSLAFFEQNSERFKANQDLIAGYEQYGSSIVELLDTVIEPGRNRLALEVGPGQGELLADLSVRFENIIALDNSEQILALAKQHAATNSLSNIEFVLGDLLAPPASIKQVDCITVNMVLHHIPTPADAFKSLSKMLSNNGTLLVTDLCQHDQAWAKDSCGDIWLGFEQHELTNWANAAGLVEGASLFLALRNGFQIQLQQFIKKDLPQ